VGFFFWIFLLFLFRMCASLVSRLGIVIMLLQKSGVVDINLLIKNHKFVHEPDGSLVHGTSRGQNPAHICALRSSDYIAIL
jgi:hypothetical protein